MDSQPLFPGVVDEELKAALGQQPLWTTAINAVWARDLRMMRLLFDEGRRFWNDSRPALPRVLDFILPRPARDLPMRLYDPIGDGVARPALVFVHGGGYVVGTLETHDTLCRVLAQISGLPVVALDYALAPEAKFPFAIHEIIAAGRYLQALGGEWGLDPARLGLVGESAGCALSMGALQLLRDAGETPFQAAWLLYGSFTADDTPSRREFSGPSWGVTPEYRAFYRDAYFSRPEEAESPLALACRAESLAGLPPILLAPAEFDPLRDDSYVLAEKLRSEGVQAELSPSLGCYHGFIHTVQHVAKAREALAAGADFMHRILGDRIAGQWVGGR